MASKTITVRNEVYLMLKGVKKKEESFSSLFERLVKSRSNLEALKELSGSVKFKNKSALLKEIYEKRGEKRY